MNVVVLSGKGGTGKTTIATNLAVHLSKNGYNSQYLDCDVEEPNGFIFLKPKVTEVVNVDVKSPQINEELCINCGKCAEHCNFNALAVTGEKVIVFEKLCHSCGLCSIVCPTGAISEVDRTLGKIEIGNREEILALRGILNISEPMSVPIINKLKKYIKDDYINILDCSPGSSCTVVNTLEGTDYAVLVTEPTKFGLHDLKIAVDVVKLMGIPFGIVINKSNEEDIIIEQFCLENDYKIIGRIGFSKDIAKKYSRGEILTGSNEKFTKCMDDIACELNRRLNK